jgi:hypothetical protein
LDATSIDPETMRLSGAPVQRKSDGNPAAFVEWDANRDYRVVVHFDRAALRLPLGEAELVLEGQTFTNVRVRGSVNVHVVP